MTNPLAPDLDHILEHTTGIWPELRDARIFVTGGTGYFGCWLLESFAWAVDRLGLNASMTVLTRSPEAFHRKAPHLASHRAITLHRGEIESFPFPEGRFTHVIHGATVASREDCRDEPLATLDHIVNGVRRTLECAVAAGARRFMLLGTGAMYGPQPAELSHVPETYRGAPVPTDERAVYAEGKRVSELLCASFQQKYGLECILTRGFAFVGPYMPLELYAISNFILDRINGRPIEIKGDSTTVRSYLYTADLAIWLWTMLVRGKPGRPYNIGSEEAHSIAELAAIVEAALPSDIPSAIVTRPGSTASGARYVPSTERARNELGLQQWISLDDAIRRTADWARSRPVASAVAPERRRRARPSPARNVTRCRVCNADLSTNPLLRYEGMPCAAQSFPDRSSLDTDEPADLELSECTGCGLIQLTAGPVSYYRDVIRAASVSPEMKTFRTLQFDAFVRRFSLKGRKVLEVGCGRGEFLSILNQSGVAAYGVEHSMQSVEQCRSAGLKVSRGFIPDGGSSLKDGPFDAFLILNFLEHLPDPNATLRGIRQALTPEAVGLIEVPNFDMIVRNGLYSEFISDHLLYFTEDTLARTLSINGFDVVESGDVWNGYILSAVVQKRAGSDLSCFLEKRTELETEIHAYLERFPNQNVAVWGAGHQALAVLSLANLAGRIKYVVDSAPFKQGKFTPGSHIPIVPPDALRSDPVDAVLVMAASYSDEVAGIIRRDFDPNLEVSVLRHCSLETIPRGRG